MTEHPRRKIFWAVGLAAIPTLALVLFALQTLTGYAVPESRELRAFVTTKPIVPIVFTSRTEAKSFEAAAPEAEGYAYPGTIPWAAKEGRLRLLATSGRVYELTWGRTLPDGSTLKDVMSPSVSLDGTRILFAGRKAPPDHGHWRIFQMNANGGDMQQLTGGSDDSGCIALPPLRFGQDGARMSDAERKIIDYDDVDPCDRGDGGFYFASSRLPDLGRDHSRRATQIWRKTATGEYQSFSANRNNDRWPVLVGTDSLIWSLWSRNREAITADGKEIRPFSVGGEFATKPTDNWMAARNWADGTHFGYLVKIPEPVWRPRALFNGQVAFMTPDSRGRMRAAQAPVGHLRVAPSSQAGGGPLPKMAGPELVYCNLADSLGQQLAVGTPSPCPPNHVLVSAGSPTDGIENYGLWQAGDDWSGSPAGQLLFDDPKLVDAEPVGLYNRDIPVSKVHSGTTENLPDPLPRFLSGRQYLGKVGMLESHFLNIPLEHPLPNNTSDAGRGPVITNPDSVKAVVIYGAHRDRFDDPVQPRIHGYWEKLLIAKMDHLEQIRATIPADPLMPTVLAGLDADGKILKWASPAQDSLGRSASYYAYAGDHYSGMKPSGYVFCNGCHTGHTFLALDITEKRR